MALCHGRLMTMILSIAAGGALGAVLRYLLNNQIVALWGGAFPMGILTVNVLGCFAMGLAAGGFAPSASPEMRAFLTTGVLGGFTTFSAFAFDVHALTDTGRMSLAIAYVFATVALTLLGVFAGAAVARGLAA
jgi:CrcB protein